MIKTPDDLADHLADLLGIYTDPRCAALRKEMEHPHRGRH